MWHNPIEPAQCKKPCKRLISATSFILKGSGWYKDGYSSAGSKKKK
jgi:predicted nucleic acid-binding Zn ribbon protein